MPLSLRRLLNRLPLPHGNGREIYVRSSWHRPSLYDQWRSQPPWRPAATLRTTHFRNILRRQRWTRFCVRGSGAVLAIWIVVESVRGLALF